MPRVVMLSAICSLAVLSVQACGSDSDGGGQGGVGSSSASGGTGGSVGGAGGTAGAAGGASGTGGAGGGLGGAGGSVAGAAGAGDSGTTDASDSGPSDPCPDLPIPTKCFGRDVMYREWGASAVGDGTYFTSQAPGRLGFTRVQGRLWLVKFQLEANTHVGTIAAYGDNSGGVAWISDKPCDAEFAANSKLAIWSGSGGGTLDFVVVKDEADSQKIKTDSAYWTYAKRPQLRGGHCYYVAFENTAEFPSALPDASFISTSTDACGANGDGTCYYLAMDFSHRLHDISTGQLIGSKVIPGLTQ